MPAYSRQGSAWTKSVARQRKSATEWTGEADLGFVRVGSEWVQFQAPVGDDLGQPINLSASPGDLEGTVTWTNDLADGVDPDEVRVQYRLPETTGVWTEEVYPITSATFGWLTAETTYQFQVRYITRDSGTGQISATGPISELFFFTLPRFGPGTPAEDPGGSGGDSIINWPSTDGTPGAVDSTDCWWEYVVQEPDANESALTWLDTATTGELAGNVGDWAVDFIDLGFACGAFIRLKYREVCNSVPGDWEYGLPFSVPCDWDAACAGVPQGNWSASEWTDAIFAMPIACQRDGTTLLIEDRITNDLYGRLPGFVGFDFSEQTSALIGGNDNSLAGSPLTAGDNTGLATITEANDLSLTMRVKLNVQPRNKLVGGTILGRFGNRVTIRAFSIGAGYGFSASWPKAAGGSFYLESATEIALDEWATVTLTIDQDGTKALYSNGVSEDTDAATDTPDWADGAFNDNLELYANPNMRVREVGGWSRVLTESEVASIHNPITYTSMTYESVNTEKYNPADRSFIMPQYKVGTLEITARGGASTGSISAYGAELKATGELVIGDEYFFKVGQTTTSSQPDGGLPGGGFGTVGTAFTQAGGGAGYTDLRHGTDDLASQILVAGGAGGDPNGSERGGHGSADSGNSLDAETWFTNMHATTAAGGTGNDGTNGSRGQGGASSGTESGGGGGGGYYGGGGGGAPTRIGGGGGSSFVDVDLTLVSAVKAAATNGALIMAGEFATPWVTAVQLAAGANVVYPMTDPFGRRFKNYAVGGATNDALTLTSTATSGIDKGCQVLGPDGLRYTQAPGTAKSSFGVAAAQGALTTPPAAAAGTGFTWEFFACRTEAFLGAAGVVAAIGSSSSNKLAIFIGAAAGQARASANGVDIAVSQTWFDTLNQWRHFLFRITAADVIELYVDGVLAGTTTLTGSTTDVLRPNGGHDGSTVTRIPIVGIANHAVYQADVYDAQHVADVMGAFEI